MSRFRLHQTLADILTNIEAARRFIGSASYEEFASSDEKTAAVYYRLQCASEAARRLHDEWPEVAEEIEARHPKVRWQRFRDLSNVYRHGYDVIDEALVWDELLPNGNITHVEEAMRSELPLSQVEEE